jgi:hypothetical protein
VPEGCPKRAGESPIKRAPIRRPRARGYSLFLKGQPV